MSDASSLQLKMNMGKTIFEASRHYAMTQEDVDAVHAHLEQVQPEFRSVACEAASMSLALADFSGQPNSGLWALFAAATASTYVPDVYTGLGCALAHDDKTLEETRLFDPAMHYRIIDGYGFYKGMFRHRQAVQQQSVPHGLDDTGLCYYDQGLGRSLWYTAAGDIEKITNSIRKFSATRHSELWRGIGIAATYLGGSDEQRLNSLFAAAAGYEPQLQSGAAISARARMQSATSGADMELACRIWCGMAAEETALLAGTFLNKIPAEAGNAYHASVSALDKQFAASRRYQFSS